MRNLEIMKRAKLYMDELADGKDPISGSAAPADSLIHQERLQRCFLYVAGLIDEVIENDGKVSSKTFVVKKLPFSITAEQQAAIELSEAAVGVSIIAKRIAAVMPEEVKSISGVDINLWCLLKGYLREDTYGGRARKVTSLKGEQLGITTIDRKNKEGFTYKQNIFDINAQSFIIKNLNQIAIDLEDHKSKAEAGVEI